MATVYRFRDMEKLLGEKYCELDRQSIYFASPEQMNDPMEGVRDIVWSGDRIVWTNLFKHYFSCLNYALIDFKILSNSCELKAEFIPVKGEWDRKRSPQMKEMIETGWNRVYDELRLSLLFDNLEKFESRVRIGELQLYLYYCHFHMIAKIQEAHIEIGITSEKERIQWQHAPFNSLLKGSTFFEILHQLESENDNFSEKWFYELKLVSESQRLRQKYNLPRHGTEIFEQNKHFLLLDFADAYIEQLRRLLWPNWYGTCFAKSHFNSSMWSHYADGHEGA